MNIKISEEQKIQISKKIKKFINEKYTVDFGYIASYEILDYVLKELCPIMDHVLKEEINKQYTNVNKELYNFTK
ncbi:hypothetical protein [Fictibacillus nanhaiensis]|uniref:hypothetical protein n=1 Tax=Fictibacillus nanhaiensis TaxID=742169 RepID=UPI003C254153